MSFNHKRWPPWHASDRYSARESSASRCSTWPRRTPRRAHVYNSAVGKPGSRSRVPSLSAALLCRGRRRTWCVVAGRRRGGDERRRGGWNSGREPRRIVVAIRDTSRSDPTSSSGDPSGDPGYVESASTPLLCGGASPRAVRRRRSRRRRKRRAQ
jgi:hypothetical protein